MFVESEVLSAGLRLMAQPSVVHPSPFKLL